MDIKKILPDNGPPINEVSKYIKKYKNELIVIKYGGNVFIDRDIFNNFITDINILNKLGISIVSSSWWRSKNKKRIRKIKYSIKIYQRTKSSLMKKL